LHTPPALVLVVLPRRPPGAGRDGVTCPSSWRLVASRQTCGCLEVRPGSMGKPTPGFDVVVIDDRDRVPGPGQEGHVAVRVRPERPVGMFTGYWRDPEATAAAALVAELQEHCRTVTAPTSTRARSSSPTSCPRPSPARSAASNSASGNGTAAAEHLRERAPRRRTTPSAHSARRTPEVTACASSRAVTASAPAGVVCRQRRSACLLREMAWYMRLRGATSVSPSGVGGSGFGRRCGGRAWQDSRRKRRLEGSEVTFDERMKPAADGQLLY
jgi:acyl-CoA synthetase (AMP-forming)/AMP-acid ligase II